METPLIIFLILCIVFFGLWLRSELRLKTGAMELRNLAGRLADREGQLVVAGGEIAAKNSEVLDLNIQLARAVAQNEQFAGQLIIQKEELQKLQENFRLEFENLANRIFDQKSEKFTLQNQTAIEGLLNPLKENLKLFEKRVEETYSSESRERYGLQKEVQRLFELNQTLSREAANLTMALKADTRTQGSWGEMILERVLEMSGLRKDIHYRTQDSRQDEQGNRKRPDVVLLLPGDRQVVIDSKVSLTAYERYCNCDSEGERQAALKAHLDSVRSHVNALGDKDYPALYSQSPDFVLMFIPLEPAYSLALQQDNGLYDQAFRKHIILVSVFTLLATLRMIESMWRLDSQNKHADDIVRLGSDLYDKFVGFTEDLKSIGRHLEITRSSYDAAMNKLTEGRGNLVRSAERMRRMGLDNKKDLSVGLLAETSQPEDPEEGDGD